MKLSGNVAFPTMLQSVLGLGSQEGGGGVHSRGNFLPSAPSPHGQVRFLA